MEQAISVTQLNREVKQSINQHFSAPVWVEGEISNLSRPRSGHLYFSLKDEQAQVRCAWFKRSVVELVPLQDGLKVVLIAEVSVYEARGEYQLIVRKAVVQGDGALQQAFEALKKTLAAEGLFDQVHKKPLPAYPRAVGVVTSATGAALRDILSVLSRRYPLATVIIYPTAVQGEQAASQIVRALALAEQRAECDVLIVARGGGSLEDLWPFNEAIVARAVHACTLPVVSGVGHETDTTMVDFVSDLRAPTPSAAAECVVPDANTLLQNVLGFEQYFQQRAQQQLAAYKQQLISLYKRLRHPEQWIAERAQRLDYVEQRLQHLMQTQVNQFRAVWRVQAAALQALSPLKTLDRGYAVVQSAEGVCLHDAETVQAGDALTVRLAKGALRVHVKERLPHG